MLNVFTICRVVKLSRERLLSSAISSLPFGAEVEYNFRSLFGFFVVSILEPSTIIFR